MGLKRVFSNIETRLHTTEALRPVITAQHEAGKETKGRECLPPTAQRVIITNGTSIPTSLPPTLHDLLNARNATSLQAYYALTYAGNNIYLPTSVCQSLLQGHILEIPDLDASTILLPLLTTTYSTVPANTQQRAIRIQVLLSIGQDLLSKKEVGKLLDKRVHILASTQDLRNSTGKYVKLTGDYRACSASLWIHGHVTLTALRGNTIRPSQRTHSLGRT